MTKPFLSRHSTALARSPSPVHVISIEAMFAELETQGVFARLVRVDHPFHHAMMQPAADALENALIDLAPQPETIPLFSTITGNRLNGNGW